MICYNLLLISYFILAALLNGGRGGVRTRAQKNLVPDEWTMIPVLVKIFKLIVGEMANNLSEALASSTVEDEDDLSDNEEEWEDEGGNTSNEGIEISKLLDPAFAIYQDEDAEEDPDAMADPIYRLNLKQYLTGFLTEFCTQPYFLTFFAQHLTHVEKNYLKTIGIELA